MITGVKPYHIGETGIDRKNFYIGKEFFYGKVFFICSCRNSQIQLVPQFKKVFTVIEESPFSSTWRKVMEDCYFHGRTITIIFSEKAFVPTHNNLSIVLNLTPHWSRFNVNDFIVNFSFTHVKKEALLTFKWWWEYWTFSIMANCFSIWQ